MLEISFLQIFLSGLLGGVHCLGMCGGLSSAFIFNMPREAGRTRLILLMNLGRILSYTLMGVIVGAISQLGSTLDNSHTVRNSFYLFAQIMVIFMGLYFAGLSNFILKFEKLGAPLWKNFFSKKLGRFLPVRSSMSALVVGMLWGWLPCGLIYSASAQALASQNFLMGGALMLTFGLGTLPNLLAMNFFANQLKSTFNNKWFRFVAGMVLVLMGISQILFLFGVFKKPLYFI